MMGTNYANAGSSTVQTGQNSVPGDRREIAAIPAVNDGYEEVGEAAVVDDSTSDEHNHGHWQWERSLSAEEKARLYDEQNDTARVLVKMLSSIDVNDEDDVTGAGDDSVIASARGEEMEILRKSLNVEGFERLAMPRPIGGFRMRREKSMMRFFSDTESDTARKFKCMVLIVLVMCLTIAAVVVVGELTKKSGLQHLQPIGDYRAVEVQEGEAFFDYYSVYEGRDSAGSNGYNQYVNLAYARERGIVKIVEEPLSLQGDIDAVGIDGQESDGKGSENRANSNSSNETLLYIGSAPTSGGPRDSVRLEGKRRFNRGLFILDVRHMPAGCGTWPAFWLTDENNWPVNGEIDIVEGVNYQTNAKTALHSTRGCNVADQPIGVMTGWWDTAYGIPDKKTGKPDMTLRFATDCFVYDPHQWLNQGCVGVDLEEGRLGQPLNDKGGGVFALEWDPINRHIRSWVFTPRSEVPTNLLQAIRSDSRSAPKGAKKVPPDTTTWGLPYAHFAIGEGTSCPADHFKQMHLVINLAFCGSVAGNRYFMDCPEKFKTYPTCEQWVDSNPDELNEAYWKIRGVYVYEREWEFE